MIEIQKWWKKENEKNTKNSLETYILKQLNRRRLSSVSYGLLEETTETTTAKIAESSVVSSSSLISRIKSLVSIEENLIAKEIDNHLKIESLRKDSLIYPSINNITSLSSSSSISSLTTTASTVLSQIPVFTRNLIQPKIIDNAIQLMNDTKTNYYGHQTLPIQLQYNTGTGTGIENEIEIENYDHNNSSNNNSNSNNNDDDLISSGSLIVLIIIYCIIVFGGVLGNASLVVTLCSQSSVRLRNPLLVALCIADLLVAGLSAPSTIITLALTQKSWTLSLFGCKAIYYFQSMPVAASTISFLLLSLDRYAAVKHQRLAQLRQRRYVHTMLSTFSWIGAFVICIPILLAYKITNNPILSSSVPATVLNSVNTISVGDSSGGSGAGSGGGGGGVGVGGVVSNGIGSSSSSSSSSDTGSVTNNVANLISDSNNDDGSTTMATLFTTSGFIIRDIGLSASSKFSTTSSSSSLSQTTHKYKTCRPDYGSNELRTSFIIVHTVLVFIFPGLGVILNHCGVRRKLCALSLTARAAHGELPLPMPILRRPTHMIIVTGMANAVRGVVSDDSSDQDDNQKSNDQNADDDDDDDDDDDHHLQERNNTKVNDNNKPNDGNGIEKDSKDLEMVITHCNRNGGTGTGTGTGNGNGSGNDITAGNHKRDKIIKKNRKTMVDTIIKTSPKSPRVMREIRIQQQQRQKFRHHHHHHHGINKSTPAPELPLPQTSTLRARRKLANLLVAAAIIFIGCWTPHVFCVLWTEFSQHKQYCSKTISYFSLLLGYTHSAISPIMYWTLNHNTLRQSPCAPFIRFDAIQRFLRTHLRSPAAPPPPSSTNEAALGPFNPRYIKTTPKQYRAQASSHYLY